MNQQQQLIQSRVLKQENVQWRELEWFQPKKLKYLGAVEMEKLKNSLRHNNFVQPFNVWDDGERLWILDGHHRQKALRELEEDGMAIIADTMPANFIDCTSRKDAARLVLLYSSIYAKIAETGLLDFANEFSLDLSQVALDLDLPNFDLDKHFSPTDNDINIEETETPDLQPIPITKRGDVYTLGRHRLLCGDSTKPEDVARLMNGTIASMLFTDPPYNVNYAAFNAQVRETGKNWENVYCNEWKDSMSDADYAQFLIDVLANAKKHLTEYGHYYVWYATTYHTELCKAFEVNGIAYDKVPIMWLKNVAPISWAHYKRKYEPCIFGGKDAVVGSSEEAKKHWYGGNAETNVWEEKRDHTNSYVHPTQKPIALPARAISNSSQENDIILELFGGSGSTLLAAEQLNRIAYLMEYEPAFCDVIIRRYIGYCLSHELPCHIVRNGVVISPTEFDVSKES